MGIDKADPMDESENCAPESSTTTATTVVPAKPAAETAATKPAEKEMTR